jgi:hypothetical protein
MSIDLFLKLPVKRYLAMNTYIRKGGKIVQPTVKRTSSFIKNFFRKSGVGNMNGTATSQREITPAK